MSERPEFDLETIRHSTAHLMAQAIFRLFPDEDIQLGVGPTTETGCYYDIKMGHILNDPDLKSIEKTMKKIIKEKLPVERKVFDRNKALEFFKKEGQIYKIELISELPEDEEISTYTQGEFVDLCRGPHVENTYNLPMSFKVTSTAGAYWRGDQENDQLQRVYAIVFDNKEHLQAHLKFLEEAKKRDHRKLGTELGLFQFEQVSPACPFFTPKGTVVYNELTDFMRRLYFKFDYHEVITPQILDSELWHTSGHYENYKENMYFTPIDEREFAVKPMNCPCHMLMFRHQKRSYRELPMRIADFGRLHRYERSGAISGLTRVRSFCQDDAHIFLGLEQIQDEIKKLLDMFFICYEHFGFNEIKINLSTRPEKRVGSEEVWDKAESALREALENSDHDFSIKEGDGAFYGPKIDIDVADALNRYHQLGTIQLDFNLPDRFDLKFNNSEGGQERPVVIHRALLGSLERFFGVYLEHIAGVFPFWLAPEQAVIIPVNNEGHLEAAKALTVELKKAGYRVRVDDRNESLGKKTRETQKAKIPYMLVMGDNEIEKGSVSIRKYGEREAIDLSRDELFSQFSELQAQRVPEQLRD